MPFPHSSKLVTFLTWYEHISCYCFNLNGQCQEMDIFWRSKHFDQYFLCIRWWFSRSFKSFSLSYTIINFLFASLKLLTYFENAYWNPPQNFLLCGWSVLLQGKCGRSTLSPAGFRSYFTESQALPVNIFSVSPF